MCLYGTASCRMLSGVSIFSYVQPFVSSSNYFSFELPFCRKLIPKNMPKACEVDTAGRHSTILPIRQCMAPLAYKRTSGRRKQSQPCRDRDLHEALTGTVITHGKPGSRHRLVAIRSEKNNSKRHSGDIPSNRGITLLIPLSVHREWIRVMLKKYSLNRFHLPS